MNPVGMILSTNPRKKRWAYRPWKVVTVAVSIHINAQMQTMMQSSWPMLKRWSENVMG